MCSFSVYVCIDTCTEVEQKVEWKIRWKYTRFGYETKETYEKKANDSNGFVIEVYSRTFVWAH